MVACAALCVALLALYAAVSIRDRTSSGQALHRRRDLYCKLGTLVPTTTLAPTATDVRSHARSDDGLELVCLTSQSLGEGSEDAGRSSRVQPVRSSGSDSIRATQVSGDAAQLPASLAAAVVVLDKSSASAHRGISRQLFRQVCVCVTPLMLSVASVPLLPMWSANAALRLLCAWCALSRSGHCLSRRCVASMFSSASSSRVRKTR